MIKCGYKKMELTDVLCIVVNGFTFPRDALTFITTHPRQVLDFADFGRLGCVCRALREFVQNIQYMHYRIHRLDYHLYSIVETYRGEALYHLEDPGHVWRFLELFGYTYINAGPEIWYEYYYMEYNPQIDVSPIHWLVGINEHRAAIALIHYNPDLLNVFDYYRWSVFHVAVRYSYDTTVFILDNHKIDVNAMLIDHTPLQVAISHHQHHTARLLLDLGADPNILSWRKLHTIFHVHDCTQCIWILINSRTKVNFNVVSGRRYTVIQYFENCINWYTHDSKSNWSEMIRILRENVPGIQ